MREPLQVEQLEAAGQVSRAKSELLDSEVANNALTVSVVCSMAAPPVKYQSFCVCDHLESPLWPTISNSVYSTQSVAAVCALLSGALRDQ